MCLDFPRGDSTDLFMRTIKTTENPIRLCFMSFETTRFNAFLVPGVFKRYLIKKIYRYIKWQKQKVKYKRDNCFRIKSVLQTCNKIERFCFNNQNLQVAWEQHLERITVIFFLMTRTVKIIIIIIFAIFSGLLTTIKCERRVVGVEIEDSTLYPFFAQLIIRKNNIASFRRYCGASLIHPQCILTAASCLPTHSVDKKALQAGKLGSVFMGSSRKFDRQNSVYTKITNFAIHPNYTYTKLSPRKFHVSNNLAICKLKNTYRLNDKIQIIPLASLTSDPEKTGQIIGIGEKLSSKTHFMTALSVNIDDPPQIDNPTPHGLYSLHDVGYTGYPTKGDAGGPLIHTVKETDTKIQLGVFSHTTLDSGKLILAHYENVQYHMKFIKKAAKKLCGNIQVYQVRRSGKLVTDPQSTTTIMLNTRPAGSSSSVYLCIYLFFVIIVILLLNR